MKAVSIVLLLALGAPALAEDKVPFCRNIQENVNAQCIPPMDLDGSFMDGILDCQVYHLEYYVGDPEVQEKCHIDYARPGNFLRNPSKPYRLRDKK